MSDCSKMGLAGSKNVDTVDPVENVSVNETDSTIESQNNLVHSEELSNTIADKNWASEELQALDINNETASQCVATSDSTFESEIDALTKIIIDEKEDANKGIADFNEVEKCDNRVELEDNYDDVGIDTILEKHSDNEESVSIEKKEEKKSENQIIQEKLTDIQDECLETMNIESSTQSSDDVEKENMEDVKNDSSNTFINESEESESKTNSNVSTVINLNNSLQMIGEAYISEDSQESDDETLPQSETNKKIDNKMEIVQKDITNEEEKDITDSIDENIDLTKIITNDVKEVDECTVRDDLKDCADLETQNLSVESNSVNQIVHNENILSSTTIPDTQSIELNEPLSNELNLPDNHQSEVLSSISAEDVSLEEKDSNKMSELCPAEDNATTKFVEEGNSQDTPKTNDEISTKDGAEEVPVANKEVLNSEMPDNNDESTFDDKLQQSSSNLEKLTNVGNMETTDSENLNTKQEINEKSDQEVETDISSIVDEEKLNDLDNQNPILNSESKETLEMEEMNEEKSETSVENIENTDDVFTVKIENQQQQMEKNEETNILKTENCTENIISNNQNEDNQELTTFESMNTSQLKKVNVSENCDMYALCENPIEVSEKISLKLEDGEEEGEELSSSNLSKSDEKINENKTSNTKSPDMKIQLEYQSTEIETEIYEDIQNDFKSEDNVFSENKSKIIDNDPDSNFSNTDVSELESAVKFLQESEEQIIDLPLELAPKNQENVVTNLSEQEDFFISEKDNDESSLVIVSTIDSIEQNSIAISEAEIISEAAKLESERKATESAISEAVIIFEAEKLESERKAVTEENLKEVISSESSSLKRNKINKETVSRPSEVPFSLKHSVIEERLKEPPKIVIPNQDIVKFDSFSASKSSLLIQKDAKIYQKIECSIKASEKMDVPKKEEKTDSENVGSPRIILKIAKSAITDCGEPKSPKSPKVHSAANSPNPDDSPGQKLGKIKLKLSKSGHLSIVSNENLEEVSTPTLSPIGMKIKLSKSGEASVVQSEKIEDDEQVEHKPEEGPIGMKIKLTKSGDASIVSQDLKEISLPKSKEKLEFIPDVKKNESSLGMKLKLSKTGDVSIIPSEKQYTVDEVILKSKEKQEPQQESTKRTESPLGMKIKLLKSGDASIVSSDFSEEVKTIPTVSDIAEIDKFRSESPVGMKIKLSRTKSSVVDSTEEKLDIPDNSKSALGMKIKLSKSGDASIIHQEDSEELSKQKEVPDTTKHTDSIGMTFKVSKTGEATILHCKSAELSNAQPEKFDYSEDSHLETFKKVESSSEMKLKLIKTVDTSCDNSPEIKSEEQETKSSQTVKTKHVRLKDLTTVDMERKEKQKTKDTTKRTDEHSLEIKIKLSKTGHPTIVTSECNLDTSSSNKNKEQPNLSYKFTEAKEELYSKNSESFTMQNESEVIIESQIQKSETSKEISHKRKGISFSPSEPKKLKFETKLSDILPEVTIQPVVSHQQKRIILESNSNVTQEMINIINQEVSITEIKSKGSNEPSLTSNATEDKMINKMFSSSPTSSDCEIIEHRPELVIVNENSNSSQDVVIIEEVPSVRLSEVKIPKKRGRPRRNDTSSRFVEPIQIILPRDPLALDDATSLSHKPKENERPRRTCRSQKSYAPPKRGRGGRGRGKRKLDNTEMPLHKKSKIDQDLTALEKSTMSIIAIDKFPKKIEKVKEKVCEIPVPTSLKLMKDVPENLPDDLEKISHNISEKISILNSSKEELIASNDNEKNNVMINDHQNWLTPTSKKVTEPSTRNESISTVQVIDEETRMSAESGSRSQTPARNIVTVSETVINEESQGSVLSTATTESERVKVKNRRMEINFDPDEGSFTVDKIAEYEWPVDRKGETFMVQEQISQYLGVKSFKRKYPDLKRRIVDMEERNYLRENGLVSEAMCDMGLTALPSSEVLDIMCSDFPDQYEEYRKHMRDKQVKEHSKKQKELTAAANAERNRIDLAEMAMQSALSWNINLNRARMDNRKSSLDLQTFTIHLPKKEQQIEVDRSSSYYPVSLIPGQYTDYYREYTPAELRYYPLNTVLYGPMKPNEHKFDSQSEGSQSDSDSDSSSDDSSSSSSDGTQGTEASQSTMDDVDMELVLQKTDGKSVKLIC